MGTDKQVNRKHEKEQLNRMYDVDSALVECRCKLNFLHDCFSGDMKNFELSADGKYGLAWIIDNINDELEKVTAYFNNQEDKS